MFLEMSNQRQLKAAPRQHRRSELTGAFIHLLFTCLSSHMVGSGSSTTSPVVCLAHTGEAQVLACMQSPVHVSQPVACVKTSSLPLLQVPKGPWAKTHGAFYFFITESIARDRLRWLQQAPSPHLSCGLAW